MKTIASGLSLGLALALVGCGGGGDGQHKGGKRPPPSVAVASVTLEDVTVRENYPGRVRGSREVKVRARVGGLLEERLYTEGHLVEQGQALFRIDRRPYQVSLQAAEAELQSARADLSRAQREWQRVSRLYEQDAVSERNRDNAQSELELARAQVAVADAQVERAELELGYTSVEAPVSGVTELESQSEGNLIEKGAELTHITQLDPVHVRFDLPEGDARARRRARQAMQSAAGGRNSGRATLIMPDGSEYPHEGTIDFTASTIDPQTGTVSARAVFPNPQQRIVPGQFVRVRVTLERLKDVVRIPSKAIMSGDGGLRVYLVDDDGRVQPTAVEAGPSVDGRRVIVDGLAGGDRVVVEGLTGIRKPGMKVKVAEREGDGESR